MRRDFWMAVLLLSLPACLTAGEKTEGVKAIADRLGVPACEVKGALAGLDFKKAPSFEQWSRPLSLTFLDGRLAKLSIKTEAYVTADKARIYIAVRCFEKDLEKVKAQPAQRDGNVWKGDSVEVMLIPHHDSSKPYYHFAMNPAGSLYDARGVDKSWNSEAKVFSYRDEKSWTVVLGVPFTSLGVKPDDFPMLWRLNVHRYRPKRSGAGALDLAFSPTKSRSNHVPSRFGLLALLHTERRLDWKAVHAFLDQAQKLEILLHQTFDKNLGDFSEGVLTKGEGPGGQKQYLRLAGKRTIVLNRNFGDIRELQMAAAYRSNADQHGVVIHGQGTRVNACRPGRVTVLGRGLKVAQITCHSADHLARAFDLGLDAFRFLRPYGH